MTQQEALQILKTGANVFLTGEPGSGKSYTVNAYVSWLQACGVEPAITASTGIAATHIGGQTIHSWSGIGIKNYLSEYDLDFIAQNKRIVDQVGDAKVLIVDEVSMLGANTLSMVDAVCRTIKRNPSPFGGLQVVLVGDFFQLPPIRKQFAEENTFFEESSSLFSFGSSAWERLKPLACYLHEQHRQEDDSFLAILTSMRKNALTDAHHQSLKARLTAQSTQDIPKLYSHNEDVDRINTERIERLEGNARVFQMRSVGPARLVENLKKGCLSPEQLVLKVGARVMFTKNDIQKNRFANGTLGVVTGFVPENGLPIVKTHKGSSVTVEFEDWSLVDGKRILASITQLPLRLAWAMTVHKSQGMSLDAAHMDLSNAFEYGQGYVALSRVRSLSGLYLSGLNQRALQVHPEILEKDEEFRAQSEAAEIAFSKLQPEELRLMQENFIKANGGQWPDEGAPHVSKTILPKPQSEKKFSVEKVREKYPNAYRPWSEAQDQALTEAFEKGENMKEIAKKFGRQNGSIHSRLIKLGLIEDSI